MPRQLFIPVFLLTLLAAFAAAADRDWPDIRDIAADLKAPTMVTEMPAAGKLVRQQLPSYSQTQVYHAMYLPTDWIAGRKYPVIVEYAGNGPYESPQGDLCSGRLEDAVLGYGISGGEGHILLLLPYLDAKGEAVVTQWWGNAPGYDPSPTIAYCKAAIAEVCEKWGGDAQRLILAGFSRGAIAGNYLGLHDDEIARLWKCFVLFSHYDGVSTRWPYPHADRESAHRRLQRLAGRGQFICSEDENRLRQTEQYLRGTKMKGDWTFTHTGYVNHSDRWVLRPGETRTKLRKWLADQFTTQVIPE